PRRFVEGAPNIEGDLDMMAGTSPSYFFALSIRRLFCRAIQLAVLVPKSAGSMEKQTNHNRQVCEAEGSIE
ncbi:hypothetical protein OFB99_24320, partial [Escherichia coli]|nr:hypothetical protein [Escherichia coli]